MRTPAEIMAGRRAHEPVRETTQYPRLFNLGGWQTTSNRPLIKPTPANLRMFGKTTYPRRAMNRIKDPIANLAWEIVPRKGIAMNSVLAKQIEVTTNCFRRPNHTDSFRSFVEQILEDMMANGAGCYEHELGGSPDRPMFMWPTDSMSIQINPRWKGKDSEPRYWQSLGYGNIGGVQGESFKDSQLVYLKQNPSTETPFGLGELEVAFAAINRKLGVSDYAGKLASNAQPSTILAFSGMSNEQLLTVREWWRNDIEGQGQQPMIAPPTGSKAEVLSLRATDDTSLFLNYQEVLVQEVATAFNIDAMALNVHHTVNRSTAQVLDAADWRSAVVPKATLIEAYITHESICKKLGFSQLQFRFADLKRDDELLEAQIFEIEYGSNGVTPNEYRATQNKPPLPGQWGDLTSADVEIAKMAARGTAEIDDPDLPPPKAPKKADKPIADRAAREKPDDAPKRKPK